MNLLGTIFHSPRPIPEQYRENFSHLFLDVIWWGVLSGSTMSFIAIYAVRLGANPGQIGWLNAVPAVISLMFALPVGQWFSQRQAGKKIFWSSVFNRLFYLPLIFMPWLLVNKDQIWFIILSTLVMSIPMTFFTVGFNSLFADAVPADWRGYVVAVRNAAISITAVITSLICGQILNRIQFPLGYQIVFFIGFIGAAASSYHLWFVHSHTHQVLNAPMNNNSLVINGENKVDGLKYNGTYWQRWLRGLRLDVLKGPFRKIFFLLFFFHLAQYMGIPIFPLYQVNQVHFSDQTISLGVGFFNFIVFVGSTQLPRLFSRFNNRHLMGGGVLLMATYPALMSISRDLPSLIATSLVGGIAWSIVGGVLYNFIMDWIPEDDRPAYLGWYHLALNAAILGGSLSGPLLANWFGLPGAMLICSVARLAVGVAILRWG
jgi:MFS family permease